MEQFLPGGRYENWTAKSATPRGIRGRLTTLFVRGDDSPEHHKSDVDFTVAEVRAVALKNDPTIENQRDSYARMDEWTENYPPRGKKQNVGQNVGHCCLHGPQDRHGRHQRRFNINGMDQQIPPEEVQH